MPRIRSIKPEFWTSEAVAAWHPESRLTFLGMWNMAEDNGVGVANPRLLAAQLYPLDDPTEATVRVERALTECSRGGQIVLYEAAGKRLYYVTGWDEHQRVNRPSRCRFARPTGTPADAVTSADADDDPPDTERAPTPHDTLTEPAVSPHTGVGGMGEGEGCRGKGERGGGQGALVARPRAAAATMPAELQTVLDAWAESNGGPATRTEKARIVHDARELLDSGTPLDAVTDGARHAAAEGWHTITRSVRKRQARARPRLNETVAQRADEWSALKQAAAEYDRTVDGSVAPLRSVGAS